MTDSSLVPPWMRLGFDMWSLGVESTQVIALRSLKLAAGGVDAQAETQLMISEKVASLMALQARAISGDLGITPQDAAAKTVSHFRKTVRANRRRLAKS
jgi:hypothetical protein